MIIKSFELEKIKSFNLNIHLIYGNNEGIKQDIIENFYLKDFDGELLKYDEQEILHNFENIISSLLTKSLFDNKKIIIISRTTEKIINFVNNILQREVFDTKIIIKSSNLEKKSKLRNLFEKEKKVLCTPVYEDDLRSLSIFVQNFVKENKLNLSQEMKNILIERSKGDRINLKNELIKLKNLSLSRKKLSTDHIIKLSNLAENYSVFELSDNYLCKNTKKVSSILNENNYSSDDCILIIRTLLGKSKRLLKIRNEVDNNSDIDQVISSFKPAIFWKEKDIVKKQVQLWSSNEVKNIIVKINELETLVKKNTANSMLFVFNFISNY